MYLTRSPHVHPSLRLEHLENRTLESSLAIARLHYKAMTAIEPHILVARVIALRRTGHPTPRHGSKSTFVNAYARLDRLITRRDQLHFAKIEVSNRLERAVAELLLHDQLGVQLHRSMRHKLERARIGSVADLDGGS